MVVISVKVAPLITEKELVSVRGLVRRQATIKTEVVPTGVRLSQVSKERSHASVSLDQVRVNSHL